MLRGVWAQHPLSSSHGNGGDLQHTLPTPCDTLPAGGTWAAQTYTNTKQRMDQFDLQLPVPVPAIV